MKQLSKIQNDLYCECKEAFSQIDSRKILKEDFEDFKNIVSYEVYNAINKVYSRYNQYRKQNS